MNNLITHMVAGYPSRDDSLALLQGLAKVGVFAIEVQVPFSDPIADGETIMTANDMALDGGASVASSFTLIEEARSTGVDTDIYVMSYVQKLQSFGPEAFCERAAAARVQGLIVPDLPFDSPDMASISQVASKQALHIIPVLSPGMDEERLEAILATEPQFIYVTSMQGITGNEFNASEALADIVHKIRQRTQACIMIGFGISNKQDVDEALALGDAAIVGSALIRALDAGGPGAALDFVRGLL